MSQKINKYIAVIQEVTRFLSYESEATGLCHEDVLSDIFKAFKMTERQKELEEYIEVGNDCGLIESKLKYAKILGPCMPREINKEIIPDNIEDCYSISWEAHALFENPFFHYLDSGQLVVASPWIRYALNLETENDFEKFLSRRYWKQHLYKEQPGATEIVHEPVSGSSYEFYGIINCNEDGKLEGTVVHFECFTVLANDTFQTGRLPIIKSIEDTDVGLLTLKLLKYPN